MYKKNLLLDTIEKKNKIIDLKLILSNCKYSWFYLLSIRFRIKILPFPDQSTKGY